MRGTNKFQLKRNELEEKTFNNFFPVQTFFRMKEFEQKHFLLLQIVSQILTNSWPLKKFSRECDTSS